MRPREAELKGLAGAHRPASNQLGDPWMVDTSLLRGRTAWACCSPSSGARSVCPRAVGPALGRRAAASGARGVPGRGRGGRQRRSAGGGHLARRDGARGRPSHGHVLCVAAPGGDRTPSTSSTRDNGYVLELDGAAYDAAPVRGRAGRGPPARRRGRRCRVRRRALPGPGGPSVSMATSRGCGQWRPGWTSCACSPARSGPSI